MKVKKVFTSLSADRKQLITKDSEVEKMKEVTYEEWQKNPTPRMMWVSNSAD